ncbi:unnamed protein product [Diabrotica balteata]|uniref:Uncharacterized protein n=1 Tax=Diabrotica balteata TaxID=107213 RepID=A0A9N9T9R7_DIABA|nr:unnamed protein product [Diabrotica balteata]
MNFSKTKLMSNKDDKPMINIEGTEIEHVDKYTNLGQNVRVSKENHTTEISRRVKMGWAAFGRLSYGAQTWIFTKINMEKIRKTQRAMELQMLGISLKGHKTNEDIRNRTKVKDGVEQAAKLKWAGHN